jgi:HK97 family phage major capsid protein
MPASLTATKRLDWLRDQRERAVAEVENITERAVSDDRDLTDEEQTSCSRRREAVERLDREIAVEVEAVERQASYEDLAGRIEPALRSRSVGAAPVAQTYQPEVMFRSAGEYISAFLRSKRDSDTGAAERIALYHRANQITTDNPGLLPQPIVGPIITSVDARRPGIDAATRQPMPASGKVFLRPRIVQHSLAGEQATEKTSLASRAMTVDDLQVTKRTFGSQVNLSFQDRDWTDPAITNLLISDMSAAYAVETSDYFSTTLVAAVTQTADATTGATPSTSGATWLAGIYDAAAQVFAAGNAVPNTLWLAPDRWQNIGATVDTAGRPLFMTLSPSNSMGAIEAGVQGGNVAGFRLVVDATLPAGTAILGDASGVEWYETFGGTISAVEPSILGVSLAIYGYCAAVVVRPELFVNILSA